MKAEKSAAADVTPIERPAELLEEVLLDVPVDVGVTDATDPMVAVGTGSSPPFTARAVEDSDAKPTEAGDDLYTE